VFDSVMEKSKDGTGQMVRTGQLKVTKTMRVREERPRLPNLNYTQEFQGRELEEELR
jgi:hypothetical protein